MTNYINSYCNNPKTRNKISLYWIKKHFYNKKKKTNQ